MMKIFRNIEEIQYNKKTVLTIGTFDGFHVGHQNLIDLVVKSSKEINGRSFVVTFEPHPRTVVSENYDLKLITTLEEKINLFEKSGIENVLIINFTPEFSKLTSEEFFEKYILKIGLSKLVIGHDHRLGKNRAADENKLKELGKENSFEVIPVSAINISDDAVSSTKIRKAITEGNIKKVRSYLNRSYEFEGKVVKGAMRGRTLGFPTANIEINSKRKIIPGNGVYFVEVEIKKAKFFGLMNIGIRPTFADINEPIIEVYIFNFSENIYYENIKVKVLNKIRDEKKFDSKEELIKQINIDKIEAEKFIKELKK